MLLRCGKLIGLLFCRVQNCVGGITCPNTRMLKVRFGRLKPTYDTRVIHFDYTLELL